MENISRINPKTLERIIKDIKRQQIPAWEKINRTELENKTAEAYRNGMYHVLMLVLNDCYEHDPTVSYEKLREMGLWIYG